MCGEMSPSVGSETFAADCGDESRAFMKSAQLESGGEAGYNPQQLVGISAGTARYGCMSVCSSRRESKRWQHAIVTVPRTRVAAVIGSDRRRTRPLAHTRLWFPAC